VEPRAALAGLSGPDRLMTNVSGLVIEGDRSKLSVDDVRSIFDDVRSMELVRSTDPVRIESIDIMRCM
jgi:hypothetical protein